jgi:toxin CcdB
LSRYTVYANPDAGERRTTPALVDVQNPYIDHLTTRVVIPLRQLRAFGPRSDRLNPLIRLGTDEWVLDTAALGAVPLVELRKVLGDLRHEHTNIQAAMDALFGAY